MLPPVPSSDTIRRAASPFASYQASFFFHLWAYVVWSSIPRCSALLLLLWVPRRLPENAARRLTCSLPAAQRLVDDKEKRRARCEGMGSGARRRGGGRGRRAPGG